MPSQWPAGGRSAAPAAASTKPVAAAARTRSRLFDWLVRHYAATFLIMSVSFMAFGVLSLDLVQFVSANTNFLLTYGWDAIRVGGFVQLVQLWSMVFAAIAAYLVFKLCEHALVERFAHFDGERP
jgi:hypothetical protein